MQIALISIIWILATVFFTGEAIAAKKFVPKTGAPRTVATRSTSGRIPVSVKYRGDKKALNFNFTNFTGLTSVSYVFQYETNGVTQGAAGSISPANSPSQSRELLFGTCSSGVCTYHSGLKNAKLTFTANYANGRRTAKIYRIKTYF